VAELYKRKICIEGKPEQPMGYAIRISDADTGEEIPGMFKATVHLNATELNTAELTYYETGDKGSVVVGSDNEPIIHTATVEHPEVSLTAFERCATTIGGYECHIETSSTPGKPYGFLTIEDETRTAVSFYPDEALELLKWLQQERQNLEELAKTCCSPLKRTLARVEEAE